ncbi:MAG: STAS/SEC14 domain-containing protein [Rhodomicrobium sp.]
MEENDFEAYRRVTGGRGGIELIGKVTYRDYETILIPMAEAMIAAEPVKILYAAALDFCRHDLQALWNDGVSGVKHWHDFTRAAGVAGLAAAEAWIANTKKAAA